jgi:aldehyde dehydrogenase (NAD+)
MSDDILNFDMFINGTWQPASDGETIEVFNPATGEIAATVPRGRRADLDTVVSAARCGPAVWRDTHPAARMRIMMRIADALRSRAQEFAEIKSLDTGESINSTLWTVKDVCARRFEYYAGCADKILGDTFMAPGTNFSYTLREPVGVTAHIVPWNGPLWTGSRSIAPALAVGNSLIVKPSSEASLSLLKLAALASECGLPAGVFNVITGRGSEMGDALTLHTGIDAIYFTGSLATGKRVLKNAAEHVVPARLELGGKSPNIVMADAALEPALYGALWAIFSNAGQVCVAGSRLLVHASIHDEFVERLVRMVRGLKLGGPKAEADMGPLISAAQRERVLAYIAVGRDEAKLVVGGGVPSDVSLRGGFFVEPTIFDNVPPGATIAKEEIFGPVLAVTRFNDIDKAIAIANDTEYGLAAAI